MRKIFFIASILFLCGISCIAQTIKQTDFDKIIDYVNCKYAKAYIENTNASQSDKDAYNNTIKPQLDNCSWENHLSYTDLYNLLKNNSWGQTADNLIKTRKNDKKFDIVASKTDSEIIEHIIEISGTFKTTIGNELIDEIGAEIREKYPNNKSQETTKVQEKTTKSIPLPDQVAEENENKRECHWLMWLIILLEAILLCGFSYFLYHLWKRYEKLEKKVDKNENADKSSDVKMFEDKLQQLDRRYGELEEKVRDIKIEPSNQNTTKTEERVIQETPISNVKFFRTKNEKTLQDELPSESGASFKIFNINNNEAKFEYCGDIVNTNFFAEICTFENNPADVPHKKEIKTTTPGTVKKDNNNWVVDKPAKIKFI